MFDPWEKPKPLKNSKNVVYFTLELNESYVGLRHDSCFTGIPFQDLRNQK